MKIKAEIKEVENGKSIEKINYMKSWLFEKINKIHKSLAKLRKREHKLLISEMKEGMQLQIPWTLKE